MKPAFAVENLSYAFGSRAVLKNLSFSVPQSHLFIIIGPNGAGKTTLIKLMVRILKIQTGQIEILQAPLATYSQKKLAKVSAYVPQGLPAGILKIGFVTRTPRGRVATARAYQHLGVPPPEDDQGNQGALPL